MANRDFDPFDIFRQLEEDIRARHTATMRPVMFHPRIDMFETESSFVVKMELAGGRSQQINIELSADDRVLRIDGDREESSSDQEGRLRCFHLEIYYGKFEREVRLPGGVRIDREQIRAEYRDGFLVVTLPKLAKEANDRRSIRVTQG